MPRYKVGVDLSPLRPLIFEALKTPAERQQAQKMMALKELAELQPQLSKLPPEERENAYNLFYQARGTYHPTFFRRIFGERPASILPAPKGSIPKVEGFVTPEAKSFNFPQAKREPLLAPEHEEEIRQRGKQFGYDDDEINALLEEGMMGLKGPVDARKQAIIRRGESFIQNEMKTKGVSREEAVNNLPPNLAAYGDYLQEQEEKSLGREAVRADITSRGEAREEKTKLNKEVEARKVARDKELSRQFDVKLIETREKRSSVERQHREMLKSKGGSDKKSRLLIDLVKNQTLAAIKGVEEHNKNEMQMYKADPNYVPQIRDVVPYLERWDELYVTIMGMQEEGEVPAPEGGGTITTPPPTRERVAPSPLDQIKQKYF